MPTLKNKILMPFMNGKRSCYNKIGNRNFSKLFERYYLDTNLFGFF